MDLPGADSESLRNLGGGLLLDDVEIENLEMLRAHLALELLQGQFHDIVSPFLIPDLLQVQAARIGHALDCRCAGRFCRRCMASFALARMPPKMVGDAIACHAQQPALE